MGGLTRVFIDLFIHRFNGLGYWEDRKRKQLKALEELKDGNDNTKYTGHAFVTFSTEREAIACLRAYNRTKIQEFIDRYTIAGFLS